MSAFCMPVCGRTVGCELFSIWMMMGAPDRIRAVDPADGTWTMVAKLSFQSATARSCLRLVAVLGTSSVWVRLWLRVNASVMLCPALSQVRLLASSAAPSSSTADALASIGCEKGRLELTCRGLAFVAYDRGT